MFWFKKKYDIDYLVKFYRNEVPNCNGLYLGNLWCFSDAELEKTHDYIQWLFPLMEKSRYNSNAPVLDIVQIMAINRDEICRENMRMSIEVFLEFLGMSLTDNDEIYFNADFLIKKENWLTKKNHNFKRITRLMTFLKLFEFNDIANALMWALDKIYKENEKIIGEKSYKYWKNAYDGF